MTNIKQVRTLTTNFQRLLAQATKEIKKLTSEKVSIIKIIQIKIIKIIQSYQDCPSPPP
jgi:hypothetical protein